MTEKTNDDSRGRADKAMAAGTRSKGPEPPNPPPNAPARGARDGWGRGGGSPALARGNQAGPPGAGRPVAIPEGGAPPSSSPLPAGFVIDNLRCGSRRKGRREGRLRSASRRDRIAESRVSDAGQLAGKREHLGRRHRELKERRREETVEFQI